MKLSLFVFSLLCMSGVAHAQVTTTDTLGKLNEIGIAVEYNLAGSSDNSTSFFGLQYNRWNNHNVGYRLIAGFTDLTKKGDIRLGTSADSITQRSAVTDIPMLTIGGALMAQRHFYRRVTMYAGIELRLAYGSGHTDTTIFEQSIYNEGYTNTTTVQGGDKTNMFYAGVTPLIGAKLIFKRIVVGMELSNTASFENYGIHGARTGEFEINSSNINQRVFIQYRF